MGIFKPHVQKRAIFMFAVLFPIMLILEYTGNSSVGINSILAGIVGGVSVILFPDPEHLKKLKESQNEESSK